MFMYRNFLTGLCAVALVATGLTAVQAQTETVDVSLNLRYNDPFDPSEGGTWQLVGKVDSGLGIAAVNAILADVDNGIAPNDITLGAGIGAIDPIDSGGANERPAYLAISATVTDLIYGQDISAGATASVGLGVGTPGDNGVDVLRNTAWDNAALLASGTFSTATRPTFTTNGSSSTASNIFDSLAPDSAASPLATTTTVRGDSLDSLGLENSAGTGILAGDANRDGTVNFLDFSALSGGFGATGVAPNEPIWDIGNFNDDSDVDFLDFSALSGSFGSSTSPPALNAGTVPEPSSVVLAAIFGLSVVGLRRRK